MTRHYSHYVRIDIQRLVYYSLSRVRQLPEVLLVMLSCPPNQPPVGYYLYSSQVESLRFTGLWGYGGFNPLSTIKPSGAHNMTPLGVCRRGSWYFQRLSKTTED